MEMKSINRREFIDAGLAASAGLLAAPSAGFSGQASPSKSNGLKVGLYTITYLGIWYRGDALTLEDAIRRAKKYGYDGVEVDGKRPHGHPLTLTRARARELRKMAEGEGIEIYGLAGNNDFSSPITEHRDAQLLYMRDLIQLAPELGAKTVRVFLAWRGVTQKEGLASYNLAEPLWETVHQGYSREEIWDWCRAGMIQCTKYAADAGVTLALQNHVPVIHDHHDVLRMVKEVNSPHLKVSLDAWIMQDKSPAAIRQAAARRGSSCRRFRISAESSSGRPMERPRGRTTTPLSSTPCVKSDTRVTSGTSSATRCRWSMAKPWAWSLPTSAQKAPRSTCVG